MAKAYDAIETQVDALDSLDESSSLGEPTSGDMSVDEALAQQELGNPGSTEENSPLTNPETAQALAQTLDALDQALNSLDSPF